MPDETDTPDEPSLDSSDGIQWDEINSAASDGVIGAASVTILAAFLGTSGMVSPLTSEALLVFLGAPLIIVFGRRYIDSLPVIGPWFEPQWLTAKGWATGFIVPLIFYVGAKIVLEGPQLGKIPAMVAGYTKAFFIFLLAGLVIYFILKNEDVRQMPFYQKSTITVGAVVGITSLAIKLVTAVAPMVFGG